MDILKSKQNDEEEYVYGEKKGAKSNPMQIGQVSKVTTRLS
jgi:hypothetical protein